MTKEGYWMYTEQLLDRGMVLHRPFTNRPEGNQRSGASPLPPCHPDRSEA